MLIFCCVSGARQGTTNHPKPGGEGAVPAFSRRLVAGAPLNTALSESSKRAKPPVRNDADVGNPLRYAQQHLAMRGHQAAIITRNTVRSPISALRMGVTALKSPKKLKKVLKTAENVWKIRISPFFSILGVLPAHLEKTEVADLSNFGVGEALPKFQVASGETTENQRPCRTLDVPWTLGAARTLLVHTSSSVIMSKYHVNCCGQEREKSDYTHIYLASHPDLETYFGKQVAWCTGTV